MKKSFLLLLVSIISIHLVTAQQPELVYQNTKDSTANYYLVVKPTGQIKGLLLLLPSFGETPQLASSETSLHKKAAELGLLTVFASLQHGNGSFYIDSLSQNSLDTLISSLQEKYHLRGKSFYLGGFSLGGSGVVKYAERAYHSTKNPRPNAIFALDPPLDFERLYRSIEKEIRHGKTPALINESQYLKQWLDYIFQGSPQQNLTAYHQISPYSYTDSLQTAIEPLLKCPITLVTEPDILWQLEERNRSLYDLNSLDCSALITELTVAGHQDAHLVLTNNKGFRKLTGKKNPHSWSIANEEELLRWLIRH